MASSYSFIEVLQKIKVFTVYFGVAIIVLRANQCLQINKNNFQVHYIFSSEDMDAFKGVEVVIKFSTVAITGTEAKWLAPPLNIHEIP